MADSSLLQLPLSSTVTCYLLATLQLAPGETPDHYVLVR